MRVCMHVVQVVVVVVVVVIKMLFIKFVKYIDWPGGQKYMGPVLRSARPGFPLGSRSQCPGGGVSLGQAGD